MAAVKEQNHFYTTGHVMLTMGSDFQYEDALEDYLNLDKLIKYVNQKVISYFGMHDSTLSTMIGEWSMP